MSNPSNSGFLIFIVVLTLIAGVAYWSTDQPAYEKTQQDQTGSAQQDDGTGIGVSFWDTYAWPRDSLTQWIMAAFSMLATGVSIWAVRLLRDTLQATRDTVGLAKEANNATKAMVKLSEETAKKQLRAYVEVHTVDMLEAAEPYAYGRRIDCKVTIKNYGQTPAYDVVGFVIGGVRFVASPGPFEYFTPDENESISTMGAGSIVTLSTTALINRAQEASIQSGEMGLFLWGEVVYRDTYGDTQTMQYRFFSTKDGYRRGKFGGCREGNKST